MTIQFNPIAYIPNGATGYRVFWLFFPGEETAP